ncbi:metal ABC transporter ATP-binding protein [Treponema sp.]|uniref:metal ABC transporter ATP-binding protein n=1 Tax=Treponema sp. TaxID=166 RepID=UPI0025FFEFBA|nr:metal ABC transporter ATP-binding protein [Treponema sp.]MCR5217105.1 metal ABC transporter ATP-binding protein [Treponema sp.]
MSCILGRQHVCCTKIQNLTVKAGNETILKDLNLHLHCGELTAIVGRNGAGKTTFIKALLDVIPHSGTIIFESDNPQLSKKSSSHFRKTLTLKKPRFGYVPQSLSVDQGNPVSVEDLVLSCTSKKPVWLPHSKKDKEMVFDILSSTHAQGLMSRRVCDLSGGELQRIMLALAVNPLPDILLLDEPVSGVDRVGLKSFYEMVSDIRHNYDITILLISHDLDLVAKHADRVVFINNTKASVGKVEEIYSQKDFIEVFGKINF